MNDTDEGLPELPKPDEVVELVDELTGQKYTESYYTADQMRERDRMWQAKLDAISAASGKAVAWRNWIGEKWAYFDADPREVHDNGKPVEALYLHPATVTDEDVERALASKWDGTDWIYTALSNCGLDLDEKRAVVRAALSSFANKENRND